MYIDIQTNQYPISEMDIRNSNPNTSFGLPFQPPENFVWVFPYPKPEHNALIEKAVEIAPQLTDKGTWEQRWEIQPIFSDYTDTDEVFHSREETEAAIIAADKAAKLSQLRNSIVEQTQKRLDAFAATRFYDSIHTAASYTTSKIPRFASDGQDAVDAMSNTWETLFNILNEVEAGTRPAPTGFSEIEPLLPTLAWSN